MSNFETIDTNSLGAVTGGGIPIKPIIKGAEKAWEVSKPWLKRAWNAFNIGTTAKQIWDMLPGHGQQPQQPQGGQK